MQKLITIDDFDGTEASDLSKMADWFVISIRDGNISIERFEAQDKDGNIPSTLFIGGSSLAFSSLSNFDKWIKAQRKMSTNLDTKASFPK